MQLKNIDFVTRVLFDVLPRHLGPFVVSSLEQRGLQDRWEQVFQDHDQRNGRRPGRYDLSDPSVQLKLLFVSVEGRPLVAAPRSAQDRARRLLTVRNRYAHPQPGGISDDDVLEALVQTRGLFEDLGLDEGVAETSEIRSAFLARAAAQQPVPEQPATVSSAPEEPAEPTQPESAPADPSAEPAPDTDTASSPSPLDGLDVRVEGAPFLTSYAHAYNQPMMTIEVHLSGAAEEIPALRVSPALVLGEKALTTPGDRVVTVMPGEPAVAEVRLVLDRSAMLDIEVGAVARFRVDLGAADHARTVWVEQEIDVLGANSWYYRDHDDLQGFQYLASFIRPSQPEVTRLAKEASVLLRDATGSDALNAYQQGDERTDQIVDAICRALHAHDITYANPPAGWEGRAQRIRTGAEVLGEQLGTCLDLAVLLAAALEQVGIDAQLWLTRTHIFVGYWRADEATTGQVVTDAARAANAVDGRQVRFVETTLLASNPTYPGLEALHTADAGPYLGVKEDEVSAVIEVKAARQARILPLPVRVTTDAGEVQEIEYHAAERDLAALVGKQLPASARTIHKDTDVPARVVQWKRELLDLSLRNRLINLTPRAATEIAVPEDILARFEDMLHAGTAFELTAGEQLRALQSERGVPFGTELEPPTLAEAIADGHRLTIDLTEEAYSRHLMKLASTARTVLQETGANNLYLALGTLRWETERSEASRGRRASGRKRLVSPLVLVPVTLTQRARARGSRYQIRLDDTGASTPNHSLLERLRQDLGIEIPGLEDPADDGAGIDLNNAFEAVRRAIADSRLPFRVEPTVHLGMFNFAGFRLWKDLEDDWRSLLRNPLVSHLVHTPGEFFQDPEATDGDHDAIDAGAAGSDADTGPDLDRMVAELPTPSDASQTQVVAQAVSGRTIMVQGPPGTGKSQTITNLIVQAMIEGKKVLFVAEKQAALEVVARRLDATGIGDLVLNLHDQGQNTTAVKKALNRALEAHAEYDAQLLDMRTRALASTRMGLNDYRRAIHRRDGIGQSLYTARTTELALPEEVPALPVSEEFLSGGTREKRDEVETSLGAVSAAARAVHRRPEHPWRGLDRAVPPEAVDRVAGCALQLRELTASVPEPARRVVHTAQKPEHLHYLAEAIQAPWMDRTLLEQISDPAWVRTMDGVMASLKSLWDHPIHAFSTYRTSVLDGPLDQVRGDLTTARGAFFGKAKKARRAMAALAPWELRGPLDDPARAEEVIGELLKIREQVHDVSGRLRAIPGFQQWGPVDLFDPSVRDRTYAQANWLRAHALPSDPTPWQPHPYREAALAAVDGAGTDRQGMASWMERVATTWVALEDALGGPLPSNDPPLGALLARLVGGTPDELDARGLHLWGALEGALAPLRAAHLDVTAEAILDGTVPADQIDLAFAKGLVIGARHLRETDPLLAGFDGTSHDAAIDRFEELSAEVRGEVSRAAASRIIERRTDPDSDVSRTKVGHLRRDIGGRSMPKIRTLMRKYGAVITRMMPCVLVSPDSAARFIPSDMQLFDMVVFDEASQITPANAVGTMGRGRSVVVVGDSKQMPPTRFAQLTRDVEELDQDDDSDGPVTDEESVLEECRRAGVPAHNLTWHYRSRSESLIAFSNELYYEGHLASFPSPASVEADPGADGYGVSMIRVDGHFHRAGEGADRKELRTNPVEARAIVEEIRSRFDLARRRGEEDPSIGVITFNVQQRDLIEALLRESGDDSIVSALDAVEGIFVKNLENVQGDERDVIFFSVAFSPAGEDGTGDVPLNFGPLNREGGERRLNVAVTRARRQVVVFCSFEPEQLHAERSSSIGLRHLRQYLDLARHGTRSLRTTGGTETVTDRHRDQIATALQERGYAVEQALGLSGFRVDLAIGDPGNPDRMLVAVLLDNEAWARRATEYDRDVLPRSVLSGAAGWSSVQRVWIPDWIHRREQVLDRLTDAVERAAHAEEDDGNDGDQPEEWADADLLEEPVEHQATEAVLPEAGTSAVPESSLRQEVEPSEAAEPVLVRGQSQPQHVQDPVESLSSTTTGETPDSGVRGRRSGQSGGRSGAVPFRAWRSRRYFDQDVLDALSTSREAREQITDLAEEIVAREHPISRDRLCGHIARAHGLTRVRASRVDAIWQSLETSRFVVDRRSFIWPRDTDVAAHEGYRSDMLQADDVDINDIHPIEVHNAVAEEYRRNAFGEPEDIMRAALKKLGGKSLTAKVRPALEKAYRDVAGEGME